jgi:hypothetical protein
MFAASPDIYAARCAGTSFHLATARMLLSWTLP